MMRPTKQNESYSKWQAVLYEIIFKADTRAENGFSSVPRSIYWAIVTLTTVGYGDISPKTSFGQALAAVIMILGYGIIAVPTGIVTVELARAHEKNMSDRVCPQCRSAGHDRDAAYCKYCAAELK